MRGAWFGRWLGAQLPRAERRKDGTGLHNLDRGWWEGDGRLVWRANVVAMEVEECDGAE